MNLPNLASAKLISIDVETKDPGLKERGPGGVRGEGYLLGVAVAVDGWSDYFPLRHATDNVAEPELVRTWLAETLGNNVPKLGANIPYDLEWLRASGFKVGGLKYDVQHAEPLLDENQKSYSLENLGQRYFKEGKDERGLIEAAARIGVKEDQVKNNMELLSGADVRPYARGDVELPLRIFAEQTGRLREAGLWEIFTLETELVDLILDMRFKGIRVDVDCAYRAYLRLQDEQAAVQGELDLIAGTAVDVWSNPGLAKVCAELKLPVPVTVKGNASLESDWLAEQKLPFFKKLLRVRQLDRAGAVFIKSKILDVAVNGRVHPQFFQLRSDNYGTRSGRLSSANPNLQQVPARNEELATIIRSIFLPEEGARFGVFDWSQQEPRLTVHYADLCGFPGAAEAARRYNEDPNTDYHVLTAEWMGIERKPAKTINLGLAYGMGKKKLAAQLNLPYAEASALLDLYHAKLPFIRLLSNQCRATVERRGFIKTLLGRQRHFNLWGPPEYREGLVPLHREAALKEFGLPLVRYFSHKALNALIQGSAADMVKRAMLDLYRQGIVPHITLHDELDVSVGSDVEARRVRDAMLDCVKLRVPLKVDVELGPSWGEVREVRL